MHGKAKFWNISRFVIILHQATATKLDCRCVSQTVEYCRSETCMLCLLAHKTWYNDVKCLQKFAAPRNFYSWLLTISIRVKLTFLLLCYWPESEKSFLNKLLKFLIKLQPKQTFLLQLFNIKINSIFSNTHATPFKIKVVTAIIMSPLRLSSLVEQSLYLIKFNVVTTTIIIPRQICWLRKQRKGKACFFQNLFSCGIILIKIKAGAIIFCKRKMKFCSFFKQPASGRWRRRKARRLNSNHYAFIKEQVFLCELQILVVSQKKVGRQFRLGFAQCACNNLLCLRISDYNGILLLLALPLLP